MRYWTAYRRTCRRWIAEGGTIKWFVGIMLYITPQLYLGLAIWLGVLILVNEFVPDPERLMAVVGTLAIGLWILDKVAPKIPSYSGTQKTNFEEPE